MNTQWIGLTVVAVLSRSMFSVASKLLSRRLSISYGTQSTLVMFAAATITLIIGPDIGGISFGGLGRTWPTASAMIASTTLGNILFFKGLQRLDATTAQIAFSTIVVWAALLSWLVLGDRFSFMQLLGIVLLIVAILITQNHDGEREIDAGIVLMIASAACFATFQVTSADLAETMTPATYLLLAHGGAAVLIGAIYARRIKSDLPILRAHVAAALRSVLYAAVTLLSFYSFSYYAFQEAPSRGVVVLLLTTQVVLSVMLGIVFLRERARMPFKIYSAIIALIASVLIAL
jgi:drug/metabolite transporter (DMT)-like permease